MQVHVNITNGNRFSEGIITTYWMTPVTDSRNLEIAQTNEKVHP